MLGIPLILSTLSFLAGCDSPQERTISRSEYVEAYVAILRSREAAPDSAAAADSTRATLRRLELTIQDLQAFAERHTDDPGYLANVWAEIEDRLRNPESPDTAGAEG